MARSRNLPHGLCPSTPRLWIRKRTKEAHEGCGSESQHCLCCLQDSGSCLIRKELRKAFLSQQLGCLCPKTCGGSEAALCGVGQRGSCRARGLVGLLHIRDKGRAPPTLPPHMTGIAQELCTQSQGKGSVSCQEPVGQLCRGGQDPLPAEVQEEGVVHAIGRRSLCPASSQMGSLRSHPEPPGRPRALTSRERTLLGSSSSRVKMSPRFTVSWDPSSNSTCRGCGSQRPGTARLPGAPGRPRPQGLGGRPPWVHRAR